MNAAIVMALTGVDVVLVTLSVRGSRRRSSW
jgi:hypothetical protein